MIYRLILTQTRLSWSNPISPYSPGGFLKPERHSLNLLHICHRIKDEIGDSWLGMVLFNFHDPETMLDKFTKLPDNMVSKIRKMRMRGRSLVMAPLDDDSAPMQYSLASALKLVPSLRLDILTVVGSSSAREEYDTLDRLVRDSNGWRELQFYNRESHMLGFCCGPYHTARKPQPSHWQGVMLDRDGPRSGSSVAIYRYKIDRHLVDLTPYSTDWEPFEQKVPVTAICLKRMESYSEADKPTLVIVKRGKGVDYMEKEGSPFIEQDLRRDMPGMTWGQIREEYRRYVHTAAIRYPSDHVPDVREDQYDGVDCIR